MRKRTREVDDGFEVPDGAIISVRESPRVSRQDLLQPSDPEFHKVYPKAWEDIKRQDYEANQKQREKENNRQRAQDKIDRAVQSPKARYARQKFFEEHPEYKEA